MTKKLKVRTSAPSTDNKYYKTTSGGGLNKCITIKNGSALPNCVGYAWGRFYEATGKEPKLSRANAEMWYGNKSDGYKRGKTPKPGAIICWKQGEVASGSDGCGHVAFVEKVFSNGDIQITQSGYGWDRFNTCRLTKASGYKPGSGRSTWNGYIFQGFIYNPDVTDETNVVTYKKGKTYSVRYTMKVRKKYSVKSKVIGTLAKGSKVTVYAIKKGPKRTWIKIDKTKNKWICAKYNDDSAIYVQ